jgi:hypothetical protein
MFDLISRQTKFERLVQADSTALSVAQLDEESVGVHTRIVAPRCDTIA